MLREYPRLGMVVHDGMRLWTTLERAHAYAAARVFMYDKRQRVRPVHVAGRLLWHVQPAAPGRRELRGEPCS